MLRLENAEKRLKDQESAAARLHGAGVEALRRIQPRPPEVNPTPRSNPGPWQDTRRPSFATADWKTRQATEMGRMRESNFHAASAAQGRRYAGPLPRENPWVYKRANQGVPRAALESRARQIGARRDELRLPRSMSDQTHELFDEHRGEDADLRPDLGAGQAKAGREAAARRGQPSAATRDVKERALRRAHSLGYAGEVTRHNEASDRVESLRHYTKSSPAEVNESLEHPEPASEFGSSQDTARHRFAPIPTDLELRSEGHFF